MQGHVCFEIENNIIKLLIVSKITHKNEIILYVPYKKYIWENR